MKRNIVRFLLIALTLVLCSSECTSGVHESPCSNQSRGPFSGFVWYGKDVDGRGNLMLVVSVDASSDMVLSGYRLPAASGCNWPVRRLEVRGLRGALPTGLRVYRDDAHARVIAVVSAGGVDCRGIWVLSLGKDGSPKTLFQELNRGEPVFRIRNGVPEVREVWEIERLMNHDWHPSKQFDGRVLVERVFRPGAGGTYRLALTRPAVAEEKRLSARDRKRLSNARRDFESEFAWSSTERKWHSR